MMRRAVVIAAGLAVFFALALGLGVSTGIISCHVSLSALPQADVPTDAGPDFRLMAEAWNTVQRYYVDRSALQPTKLTYGAISGMVDALGDNGHSTFLTPRMVARQRDFEKNKFTGIGAEVQMKAGNVVIVAPFDGSPAQRGGVRAGDIILKVDEENIAGLPLFQVVERIIGPPGTSVTLTTMTPATGRVQDLTLIRQAITVQNVTWQRLPGNTIAHVRIASFSEHAAQNLRVVLEKVRADRLTGVILDLRNNPGGLLEEAIGVTSQFIEAGNLLLEKNSKGQVTPVPTRSGGALLHLPLVAIVNGGTASAAEITAGALKDRRRATLVGESTFGTGTVLKQFNLSDGSALLIATEEWLTPNGQTIWHKGIIPDVMVPLPADVLPTFPLAERGMSFAELHSSQDVQLLRSLELLAGTRGRKE